VVEDGEEGADEDDGGKDGEGEDAEGVAGVAERPKTSEEPSAEWPRRPVMTPETAAEDGLAVGPLDDEEGEDDLQAETPGDGAPADGAAVGGEGVGEAEEGDEAEQTGETCQGVLLWFVGLCEASVTTAQGFGEVFG
jgi:hypothetical protein